MRRDSVTTVSVPGTFSETFRSVIAVIHVVGPETLQRIVIRETARQQEPLETVSTVPDVSIMSLTFGKIEGGVAVEMMLDFESSISLVTKRVLNGCASQVE